MQIETQHRAPDPLKALPADPAAKPPEGLRRTWEKSGLVARNARWVALSGGRSNAVWRIETPGRVLVCRLFRPGAENPLFPNLPRHERLALAALAGSGLAPEFMAAADTAAGISHLLAHVPGSQWRQGNVGDVARILARLHALPVPDGLPHLPSGASALRAQSARLRGERGGEVAMAGSSAGMPAMQDERPVFLHGDPVPGNLISSPDGIVLIDWQCPRIGDPVHDLALFLSPAMQHVNGNRPLSAQAEVAFLSAYCDHAAAARYRALAPLYHERMIAYCRWKAAGGDRAYVEAERLERTRLAQL